MIEEKAFIVDIQAPFAWVETQRKSTCSACQLNKGCGTATLSKVLGQKRTQLKVRNPQGYKVGDQVTLGLDEGALVKGSLLLYALPLLSLFVFAALGYSLFFLYELVYTEGFKILFSLLGLGFGFWLVSRYSKKLSCDKRFQATILGKVEEPVRF